jgi:ABC-type sugar transport system ATPase subunit
MNLSDRVIVMRKGRVVGILSRERFSQEAIMTLAAASDAA